MESLHNLKRSFFFGFYSVEIIKTKRKNFSFSTHIIIDDITHSSISNEWNQNGKKRIMNNTRKLKDKEMEFRIAFRLFFFLFFCLRTSYIFVIYFLFPTRPMDRFFFFVLGNELLSHYFFSISYGQEKKMAFITIIIMMMITAIVMTNETKQNRKKTGKEKCPY